MQSYGPPGTSSPLSRKPRSRGPTLAKDVNRMRVYRELKKRKSSTRAELARVLGLNKNTVYTIVEEWQSAGFVRDLGQADAGGAGRRPTIVEFVPEARLACGFQVSATDIHGVMSNLYAEPLQRASVRLTDTSPEAVVASVAGMMNRWASVCDRSTVLGLGVGVPGLFDVGRSRILASSHMGWKEIPLLDLLQKAAAADGWACPVLLDNSVKLASMGEYRYGNGRVSTDPFVYCHFGNGVGCSILINGSILRGATNSAGELGHVVVEPDGLLCLCGNRGCLETVVGVSAVERRVGPERVGQWFASNAADNEAMRYERDRIGTAIGTALSGLVNLINPSAIVCDGPLMRLFDSLKPIIEKVIDNRTIRASSDRVGLIRSTLAPYTGSLGAAACVVETWESRLDSLESN